MWQWPFVKRCCFSRRWPRRIGRGPIPLDSVCTFAAAGATIPVALAAARTMGWSGPLGGKGEGVAERYPLGITDKFWQY